MLIVPTLPVKGQPLTGEYWEDACTKTAWLAGERWRHIFYAEPQVVDVGEGFVEYNWEQVKPNEFWIDCPTSSFNIKTATIEVWTVNRTQQVLSKCIWQLWAFNGSAWVEIEDSDSTFTVQETDTSMSLEHWRIMEDASIFNVTWTFGNKAKASVSFEAGIPRAYAITWHIESPKATREKLEESSITFLNGTDWLCLLDYFDARVLHNQTQLEPLGKTGRKARVTFANKTFEAGEQLFIDPLVDTFYSMQVYDGYLRRHDNEYPCGVNTTIVSTSSAQFVVGQELVGTYTEWRSFLSFNTTSVNASLTIERMELNLYLERVSGSESFYIKVFSGFYNLLNETDWDISKSWEGFLCYSLTAETLSYQTLIMNGGSACNKTGLTQFILLSNNEEYDYPPTSLENMKFTQSDTNLPYLDIYYMQDEEDDDTKGTGEEDGTSGGQSPIEEVAQSIQRGLAETGLYWIAGLLAVVVVGGVYAGTKTKRVSRKARGKTGGRLASPRGQRGRRSSQPRGTPKGRRRDARGRFK